MIRSERARKHAPLACFTTLLGAFTIQAVAAPTCYPDYGPVDTKPSKLYLYFPLADDPPPTPLTSGPRSRQRRALTRASCP